MTKICIVGDFSENQDEGLKNIAYNIVENLSTGNELLRADINKVFSLNLWNELDNFKPEIIHYVNGRTSKSFILLKLMEMYTGAKTIISAFHPDIISVPEIIVRLFKPSLVLIQDNTTAHKFRNLKCKTEFLSNGVDIEKFKPVTLEEKKKLREKYGVTDKFVILHVGHLIKNRNLQIFNKIQNRENQVVVMGSTFRDEENGLYNDLKKSGCIVMKGYFKNIEDIYQLSDCYVFPVLMSKSISTPLSVLEAMACNLPVITTKFEGLINYFQEGNGLIFVEKEEEIINLIENLKVNEINVKTRDKVLQHSWKEIIGKLEEIYDEIITQ